MIDDDFLTKLQQNKYQTGYLLRCSLLHFIAVFHFYIFREQFTFKKFHLDLIKKLESLVYGKKFYSADNLSNDLKNKIEIRNTINQSLIKSNKENKLKLSDIESQETDKNFLYIGMPPRFGKSQIIKYFIAWSYAINPKSNFIYTSYGSDLIIKSSKEIREIIASRLYYNFFGLTIDPKTSGAELWQISGGGAFRASTLQGVITGFGAGTANQDKFGGALIIDDFLKASDAGSQAEKKAVISAYTETLKSRLNNPKVPIVIIAQRLAVDDLIGYIEEIERDDWEFYLIKGFDEASQKSIWEERISTDYLLKMKNQVPFVFYSQYQQEPIVAGGDVFKTEYWQFYDTTDLGIYYKKIFICCDTAMKTGEANDFTVLGAFGVQRGTNIVHLLDLVHGKFEAPELEAVVMNFYKKWRQPIKHGAICSNVYIEDKASGTGLIQSIKRKGIPITPIRPNSDKFTRSQSAVPVIASGNFKLPNGAGDFISRKVISECEAFRADMSHKHDDIVDVICYGIEYGTKTSGII
jgi:predicted phage terminase large subunit-like protein